MANHNSLITVEKRILLHLLNYHNFKRKYDVPNALTQNGIAEAVGTKRNYVSLYMKKLIKKKYLHEFVGQIKHGKRIQKYFLLTHEGKEHSKKLKNELLDWNITLKQMNGELKIMKLKDIMPCLNEDKICPDITELDVYRTVSKDCILDIENLGNIGKTRFVDFSTTAPEVLHFWGRKKELGTLKKWMEDKESHNIIFIHGMAGIGKTTLAAKLMEGYRQSKHQFWHCFHELDTLRGLMLKLAEFLSKLGHNHLEMYFKTRTSPDYYEVSRILGKSMGAIDAVLVFDDFQKSSHKIRTFFAYFPEMLSLPSKTKVLILSREIVPFYDESDVIRGKIIAELEVEGLDFGSSKSLLKKKGIDKRRFKEIYEFTAGNPLFLEIIESKDRLERYLHCELFSRLDEEDRKILGIISIYRFPVPEESLAVNRDFDFERLYDLTQKSIVKKDSNDGYFIHDIIKQFFYNRLSPSKRIKHHLLAARWYVKRNESIDLIEAIYHYLRGEEYGKASQVAIDSSESILEGGYASEFLLALETFDEKNLETRVWAEILILKGKACNMCGEWKKALRYFNESSEISSTIGDKKLEVRAICESGHILEEQNQFDEAMKCFKKCLDISKKADYLQGKGESYRGIGRVHWRRSEHEEAIANYRKSLEISEGLCNLELVASTNIDLGNIYDEKYEKVRAIECYNKSLDILRKIKNKYVTTRAYLNLAVTFRHLEEFDKAIYYYTKTLALAKNVGDARLNGYGYAGLGHCFAQTGKFEKAKEYAEKAEEIALKIGSENIMLDVHETQGLICRQEGRWNDAVKHFQRGIELLEKVNAFYQLSDLHFEFGLLYKERDDAENAKKHLDTALKLYTDLGLEKNECVRDKLSVIETPA